MVFRCICKVVKSDSFILVGVFICLLAWNSSAPTGQIFMKFNIWVFFETDKKIQVSLTFSHQDLNGYGPPNRGPGS
jgi:hypothetical protein